jgi:hypothetical protein
MFIDHGLQGVAQIDAGRWTLRHFGGRDKRHDGPVKRAVFLLLMPVVATASFGCGSYVSAGAATSRPSLFCTSIEPGVKASQQLKLILVGVSSHTVSKTKSQLLTEIHTILNTFRSVKVQLHSAPANVRSSFKWEVLAGGEVNTALRQATTKRQIRAAVGEIVGSHPKEGPFITYLLSQCERPAPSGVPATQ